MSMVCPKCKQNFDHQLDCPACGCRLKYHLTSIDTPTPTPNDENWQQTSWGRIAGALLLAQGLAYGAQHFFSAGFLVGDDTDLSVWGTTTGLVLLFVIHAVSLLIGTAVGGAGQPRGILYGSLIGLIDRAVFLVVQSHDIANLSLAVVYGQFALFAILGALGGWLGMLIWKPMPVLPLGGRIEKPNKASFDLNAFALGQYFRGQLSIPRILLGTVVVVLGVLWAKPILHFIVEVSDGTLTIDTHVQEWLLLMEIASLATLAGAALAGATTQNGLKQGLFVGIAAAVIIAGIQLGIGNLDVEAILLNIVGTLCLTMLGGWFGGELFPPVAYGRRRRSIRGNF
jgi:hypothetical protein